ncbi:MAG: DUF3095 domain-containing protein [Sulfitobacter sp.]|nr:DUF3095 domain-containing protein [Sulfitobacter sp.]
MAEGDSFYDGLPRVDAFGDLTETARYRPLPEGWFIGTSDIVDSTGLVAAGQYKTVNMVGAAVISGMINAVEGRAFPFVFGGDGANFAIPAEWEGKARDVLARVVRWAEEEFDIELRGALIPMEDIRAAGVEVRVARYQASEGADYAMFGGRGMAWAETRMKAGDYLVGAAPEGSWPDLTGLSCRWSHMPARNGTILSLVVSPRPDAPIEEVMAVYDQIIVLAQRLERNGHPAPAEGPGSDWPPKGAGLEAQAQRNGGPLGKARRKALFESLVARVLIRTGIKVGGFDARRYARVVGENADFRKLDDSLKMTLDCDAQTQAEIEQVLERAEREELVRYGISTQDEAMMTCIVPSILTDDHVHFIDGAAGGYTLAARRIKQGSG